MIRYRREWLGERLVVYPSVMHRIRISCCRTEAASGVLSVNEAVMRIRHAGRSHALFRTELR